MKDLPNRVTARTAGMVPVSSAIAVHASGPARRHLSFNSTRTRNGIPAAQSNMNMKIKMMVALFGAAIFIAGCSTRQKSDVATLQGTWKGRVIQGNPEHPCSLVFSGRAYEFRDEVDTNVWYKGTFILREDIAPRQFIAVVSECPFPQYVGKTSMAIYRLENGTLTTAGNEPGIAAAPLAFDAPEAARMELKRK